MPESICSVWVQPLSHGGNIAQCEYRTVIAYGVFFLIAEAKCRRGALMRAIVVGEGVFAVHCVAPLWIDLCTVPNDPGFEVVFSLGTGVYLVNRRHSYESL